MGISIWQLLIILLIVLLLFGAKRLRTLGSDLGTAVKGFKDSVKDAEAAKAEGKPEQLPDSSEGRVIDGEATQEQEPAKKQDRG